MNPASLRALSRQLVRQLGMLETQCGEVSLTPVQAHALIELERSPCSVNQMAKLLNVDKSNASRTLNRLSKLGFIKSITNPKDKRSQVTTLTEQGLHTLQQLHQQQNHHYQQVIDQLPIEQLTQLESTLTIYNQALLNTERQKGLKVRPLTPADNLPIASVIRTVSAEFGLTEEQGYAVGDPTLDCMSEVYCASNAQYWIIEAGETVVGGGGVAPLIGEEGVCELQKMYFLPQIRGKGLAKTLVTKALNFAQKQGYKYCYLETTAELSAAVALYESLGFEHIKQAMGNTGHEVCEIRMLKVL